MSLGLTFLKCLLPRLLLAAIFSFLGELGPGGDPAAYHILGQYLHDTLADPAHADLDRVLRAEGLPELEESYAIHAEAIRKIREPESPAQYFNTVLPLVALHAAVYFVWNHPFSFVLLTSILSALANAGAAAAFRLDRRELLWLALNPVSIFFAATHFKESVAESLALAFVTALYGRARPVRALLWVGLMLLFRPTFAALLASFYVFKHTGVGRLRPAILFAGIMVALLVAPPFFHLDEVKMEHAGALYSLVYRNAFTMKLLGPLLGLALPTPLHFYLVWPDLDLLSVFTGIYGIFYYAILVGLALHWRYLRYSAWATRMVNTAIFVSLMIGYLFVGASGVKDRYFAPFLPVMILALLQLMTVRRKLCAAENEGSRTGPEPLPLAV